MSHLVPDTPPPEDVRQVLAAAAVLDVSEYRVFELAYRRWYGQRPRTRQLEGVFAAYMYRGAIPPWVRAFVRGLPAAAERGDLNRRGLGLRPCRDSRAARRKGIVYLGVLAAAVVFLIVAAGAAENPWPILSDCVVPPCY